MTLTNMPISFPSVIRAHKVVVSDWLQMLKAVLKERGFLTSFCVVRIYIIIFQIRK